MEVAHEPGPVRGAPHGFLDARLRARRGRPCGRRARPRPPRGQSSFPPRRHDSLGASPYRPGPGEQTENTTGDAFGRDNCPRPMRTPQVGVRAELNACGLVGVGRRDNLPFPVRMPYPFGTAAGSLSGSSPLTLTSLAHRMAPRKLHGVASIAFDMPSSRAVARGKLREARARCGVKSCDQTGVTYYVD